MTSMRIAGHAGPPLATDRRRTAHELQATGTTWLGRLRWGAVNKHHRDLHCVAAQRLKLLWKTFGELRLDPAGGITTRSTTGGTATIGAGVQAGAATRPGAGQAGKYDHGQVLIRRQPGSPGGYVKAAHTRGAVAQRPGHRHGRSSAGSAGPSGSTHYRGFGTAGSWADAGNTWATAGTIGLGPPELGGSRHTTLSSIKRLKKATLPDPTVTSPWITGAPEVVHESAAAAAPPTWVSTGARSRVGLVGDPPWPPGTAAIIISRMLHQDH